MSVLTFQLKQRALGDIHFCFLSQLAYNSEILSKFVCGKEYEHKYIRDWLGNYEVVGVKGISKEKLAELRFNDSSLHLPKVIRSYHPRYLQMNKNKTNWGKEIYSIFEQTIRDL